MAKASELPDLGDIKMGFSCFLFIRELDRQGRAARHTAGGEPKTVGVFYRTSVGDQFGRLSTCDLY